MGKKLLAIILTLTVALTMGVAMTGTSFAAENDGKVTVENATVGVTYKAYKVFDATYSGDNITYTADSALFAALGGTAGTDLTTGPFKISGKADSSGNHNVKLTNSSTDADTIAAWINTNLSNFTEVTATSGLDANKKATANTVVYGNLAYGYYYVTSGLGAVVTIDSAKKEVVVKDKNLQAPSAPEKTITAEDAVISVSDQTGLSVDENDAAVGTKESFKVTYKATNYVTTGSGANVTSKKVTKFYVEDQPSNLTIDKSTVAVKVGNQSVITGGSVVDNTNYPATISLATGDAGKLTITIDWVNASGNSIYAAADGQADIPVVLTYDATVLAAAATNNAGNTAKVQYDRTGETKVDLGNDSTKTYTYKFKLKKVEKGKDTELNGAEFELYLGETKVSLVKDGDNYRVAAAGESGATTTILVSAGHLNIIGLDKQNYTLKETKAPEGYSLAEDTTIAKEVLVKADGTITDNSGIADDTGVVTVEDEAGVVLPSTGGIGTTIFYILGALLVIICGIVLIARRRMTAK